MTFQILIPKRTNSCSLGDEPFESGEPYYSIIAEATDEGYQRKDFCASCWDNAAKEEADGKTYWKGTVPQKKTQTKYADLSRDQRALEILKDCLAEEAEEAEEDAFILALFLSRKRQLLTRKVVTKEGKNFQLFEISSTEEVIAVPALDLDVLDVETIQKRVADKMKGKNLPE